MHTVPTLKVGDLVVTDSHAILIYFMQKHGADHEDLWPEDDLRIKVLNRMFYSATTFFKSYSDVTVMIVLKRLSPKQDTNKPSAYPSSERNI